MTSPRHTTQDPRLANLSVLIRDLRGRWATCTNEETKAKHRAALDKLLAERECIRAEVGR